MLLTVNYYDEEGRLVQSKSQNHVNGTDVVDNTYDFIGQLKASLRTHIGNGATTTIAARYDLDHMGRKLATWESINGAPEIALNRMYYNELGQLLKKSVHSSDTTNFLQSGTYAYNERGWTKTYTSPQFSYDLKYQDGSTPQFNGNIANQYWGSNASYPNVFTYGYDKLNRLLSGTSTGTVMSEVLTYDVMGNIASLNRNGALGTYDYTGTGNKLKQVTGGLATGLYTYDANGNAKIDGRTGVTLTYNQLNLPATVSKSGLSMAYTYDATGAKLRKVSNGATRDYVDGIEYDGTNIDIIHTEEGLARRSGTTYSYEYNLTDQLGNVRLSFYKNPASNALEILQRTNYYPFGKTLVAKDGLNKYLYNGKELQQELGQLDYGARFYDPEIGRWNLIDPMAENHVGITPYNYVLNNPLMFSDEFGLDTTKVINLLTVNIVANAPKRKAFTGFWGNVNYYWNGGNFDGYQYNKDGKATGLSPIMGTPPDLSRFPLGSFKSISKLFSLSKWKSLFGIAKYAFKISAKEGDLIFYTTKVGEEVIEFGGTFSKTDDVLTIKNFDIDGALTNKLGIKGIKDIMNEFGKSQNVSKIVVEGAKRTTGANPGRLPTKLTFDIK